MPSSSRVGPRHLEPRVRRGAPLRLFPEAVQELLVRGGRDVAVADPGRDVQGLGAEGGDQDLGRRLGTGPDPGVLHGVVAPSVADVVTGPERPDHLDRLLEHLETHVGFRPRVPEHVLVERLAGPHAQPEPPLAEQDGAGRGRLGDDRRVDSQRRAGHGRRHRQVADLGERPDHRPHERRLALFAGPGMEVVADPQRVEAGLLGQPRLLEELLRRILLARQEVPQFRHAEVVPGFSGVEPGRPWLSGHLPG